MTLHIPIWLLPLLLIFACVAITVRCAESLGTVAAVLILGAVAAAGVVAGMLVR